MTKVCPITIGFSSLFVILSSFFPQEINKNNPNIKINIDLNNLFIKTFPLSFIFYFSTLFPTIFPTSTWLPIRDLPFLWTTSLPALLNLSTLSVFRSEEHTSELQSRQYLVCRLLLEKKKI